MLILSCIYIQEIEILSASQNSPNNGNSLSIEVPCKETEPKEEKVPIQSPFQYEEKKTGSFFKISNYLIRLVLHELLMVMQ